jgi:hypothetical protein
MRTQLDILEFRINTFSLIRPTIYPALLLVLIISLFTPLIIDSYNTDAFVIILIILSLLRGFIIISNLILHINYYRHDKDKIVVINKKKRLLIITKGEQTIEIPFEEIEYLEKLSVFFFRLVPTSYYCYCVNLKNKQSIYLSRLLVQGLEKELPGISFDNVACLYPYIKKK